VSHDAHHVRGSDGCDTVGTEETDVPRRLLVPAEHGTWGEILFPLLTALLIGTPGAGAWALAGAAVSGYLASEGLQTLLGLRGPRARRDLGHDAAWSVTVFGGAALLAAALGLMESPSVARVASLAAGVVSLLVWWLAAKGRIRTSAGEVVAGTTLSGWCVPVALAAGLSVPFALGLWALWSAAFAGATLAVRALIARNTRRDPAGSRRGALSVVALTSVCLVALAARETVPAIVLLGFAPLACVTAAVAAAPIPARRLRAVGWTIVGASAVLFATLLSSGV
jgi:hypothetical protein